MKIIYLKLKILYNFLKITGIIFFFYKYVFYWDYFKYIFFKKKIFNKKKKFYPNINIKNEKFTFKNGINHYNFKKKDNSLEIFDKYNFISEFFNEYKLLKKEFKNNLGEIFEKKNEIHLFKNEEFLKENIFKLKKIYSKLSLEIYLIFFFNIGKLDLIKKKNIENNLINLFRSIYIIQNPNLLIKPKYRRFITKKFNNFIINNFNSCYLLSLFQETHRNNGDDILQLKKFDDKLNFSNNFFFGRSFYAYGHTLDFIFQKFKKKQKNILISVSPKFICNGFLGEIINFFYKKKLICNHNYYIKNFYNCQFKYMNESNENPFNSHSSIKIAFNEFISTGKIKPVITNSITNKILKKLNYNPLILKKPYVCIYMQDGGFKKQHLERSLEDTFIDINDYLELIQKLINLGYLVVRLGDINQKKLDYKDKNYFEYSHSKHKNDINDITIPLNCEFFINAGIGGGSRLPLLLGKYSLNLDVPFYRRQIFDNKAFYQIRPLKNKKDKIVNYEKYFSNELNINHNYNRILEKGYKISKIKKEILIESLNEFLFYFKSKKNNLILPFNKKKAYPYNILCIEKTAKPKFSLIKYL